jgi:hypothetical protein
MNVSTHRIDLLKIIRLPLQALILGLSLASGGLLAQTLAALESNSDSRFCFRQNTGVCADKRPTLRSKWLEQIQMSSVLDIRLHASAW